MPTYVLHYAGLETPVEYSELKDVREALQTVTGNEAAIVVLRSGWTILVTAGMPSALQEIPDSPVQSVFPIGGVVHRLPPPIDTPSVIPGLVRI
ncbi:hypothetical protein [Mycobacteroides abscessus]|uniref:Uncharacterized protein n=1 Tax=Mycobacteroides abscessus TaxID=36809 RepID=A0ABD7HGG6_9MYCO|nr:hypothetical protein [Mycobacteroides abscessus]RIT28772.1 hypothetical protein D2E76_26585 [Mycobacteroides abscessus]